MYARICARRSEAGLHQRRARAKLKRLAARWDCTEALIVRRALDQLPDADLTSEEELVERLGSAGMLVASHEDRPLRSNELERMEREDDAWFQTRPPIGLGDAVLEDREGR